MSYLLMQILLCLLIAGLIGLIIGWLLRGSCKKSLLENDDKWNLKINSSNKIWAAHINTLKEESTQKINALKKETIGVREALADSNTKLLKSTNELDELDLNWVNRLKIVEDNFNKKEDDFEHAKEKNKIKQKSMEDKYSAKFQKLLSSTKNKLAITEQYAEVKKEKLEESLNKSWNNKVQKLIEDNDNTVKYLNKKLTQVNAKLSLAQNETKNIKIEFDTAQSKILENENDKEKLKIQVESQIKELNNENDNKIAILTKELFKTKEKLILIEQKSTIIEKELKSEKSAKEKAEEKLKELENQELDKDEKYELLNTIYEWKQKYKDLETELIAKKGDHPNSDKSDK